MSGRVSEVKTHHGFGQMSEKRSRPREGNSAAVRQALELNFTRQRIRCAYKERGSSLRRHVRELGLRRTLWSLDLSCSSPYHSNVLGSACHPCTVQSSIWVSWASCMHRAGRVVIPMLPEQRSQELKEKAESHQSQSASNVV